MASTKICPATRILDVYKRQQLGKRRGQGAVLHGRHQRAAGTARHPAAAGITCGEAEASTETGVVGDDGEDAVQSLSLIHIWSEP